MIASPRRVDLTQCQLRRRLCILWLLGLLCGSAAAWMLGVSLVSPWCGAASPWACVGRLLVELCTAAALLALSPELLSIAVFCRAAVFGFTAQSVYACFGSAGWLLWPMVLWPRLAFFPFLFFLQARRQAGAFLLSAAAAVAIGFADFRLVMPFVAFLIE